MKKHLLLLAVLVATALQALCQEEEPDREDDPEFMQYFDEAYSVYLDASNRCAGISELTGPEAETVWTAETWGPVDYDLSFDNSVMTVKKTVLKNEKNWAKIDLHLTQWQGGSEIKFPHLAEKAGTNVDTLTGMFVDMSIEGLVQMSFEVKTDTDFELRIDIVDANGRQANGKAPAEYLNSLRQIITAEDGWTQVHMVWSDPLFDYYTSNYWGEDNGMSEDSDPLWAYNEDGEMVTYTVEAETPVPVSMQTICKIQMIIDDGMVLDPGAIGSTKTVSFRNMILGDEETAVPFKAVTDENIAAGHITYNPRNAKLVRAREDIDWGDIRYCSDCAINTAPYQTKEFEDVILAPEFGSYTIDLNEYFDDYESELLFSTEVQNLGSDVILSSVNGSILTLSKAANDDSGVASIDVRATDPEGMSAIGHLFISAGGASQPGVFVKEKISDLVLYQGFGQHTINFDDYFATTSEDIVYSYKLSGNVTPDFSLSNNVLMITETAVTESATITVTAADMYFDNSVSQTFTITFAEEAPNRKPFIVQQPGALNLLQGFGSDESLNLSEIFYDPDGDTLSYSVDVYIATATMQSVTASINENKLAISELMLGLSFIQITASDGEFEAVATVEVSVLEHGNQKPEVADELAFVDLTQASGVANVYLSQFFTDTDELTYSMIWPEAGVEITGNQLQVNTAEAGVKTITVGANDGKGGETLTQIDLFISEDGAVGPQTTSQVLDQAVAIEESKSLAFSDYFSWTYGEQNFMATSHDKNVVQTKIKNDSLILVPIGTGRANVSMMVAQANGTHAEQTFTVTVDAVTSADEVEEPELSVFPTVFTETLTVQGAGGSAITVFTMAGMPVFTLPAISSDETLYFSHLAPGMYFLHVNDKTFQIIKK